jgi:hypothetical protein
MGAAIALGSILAVGVVGCSSTSSGSGGGADPGTGTSAPSGTTPPVTAAPRPDGPVATLTGPLTGGKGMFLGAASSSADALAAADFTETEYTASGSATSYTAPDGLPTDGTYALEPNAETADFTTRIVVRRPADPSAFNGAVVVEWLNVSGGVDAAAEYTYLEDEILRSGYAWVGVSAQRIGVEGGPVAVVAPGAEEAGAGTGLKGIDPDRYGELVHPGDAYAYDMYTQVARSLLSPGAADPLDGLDVQVLLAAGESQSAFALTTYYNGVQPLTEAFDGFLIHSRGGAGAPIEAPAGYIDIAGSIGGKPTTLRADQSTPAIVVQTESDLIGVLNALPARQPDSEYIRTWEVAGAAHADEFQVGAMESAMGCAAPINRGQQVFVLRAALDHLHTWVTDDTAPPNAEVIEVDTATRTYVLDEVGNVKGGVRTPVVDAPVDVLSGLAPEGSTIICLLLGSTTPIPAEQLATRYPSADAYLDAYTEATDAAIAAGFVLEADRDAILDGADPSRITG